MEALQRRRQEIEGNPADVQRCTEIILPIATPNSSRRVNEADDNEVAVRADGDEEIDNVVDKSALARKVAKLMGEDNTPLLTEAVRSLQKAQKELIYSKTVIKIR